MNIVLCSKSILKLGAINDAAQKIWPDGEYAPGILQIDVASGGPPQPFGDDQILDCALTRARNAVDLLDLLPAPKGSDRWVIAFENGIASRAPDAFADLAYVVVLDLDGHVTVRSSRHVLVPEELVSRSRESDWRVTCGELEALRTPGADPADPHSVWSRGRVTRRALLAQAAHEALCAAMHAVRHDEVYP